MLRTINMKLYKDNKLEFEEKNIRCIEQFGNYSFKLKDSKMVLNDRLFLRENNDFKFKINIKDKTSEYLLKEKNLNYDIKVEKIEYQKNQDNITIIYKIETDNQETKIVLEKAGE